MTAGRRRLIGLGTLFGLIALGQTLAEPTDGLAAQPVRSLWMRQGRGSAEVGHLVALVALPWSFKPILGLLTDAVPLGPWRRRGHLVLGGGLAALALGWAGWVVAGPTSNPDSARAVVLALCGATAAVALADVASDALLIEHGMRIGRVGALQATQWGFAYVAAIAVGGLAGRWSEQNRADVALMASALAALLVVGLAVAAVRDPAGEAAEITPRSISAAVAAWWGAIRSPVLWRAGVFLFLWNFNPFTSHVLQRHLTRTLGLGEQFFGWSDSVQAAASVAACLVYPSLAARVAFPTLARWSVGLGVLSTLIYAGVAGPKTALVASAAAGLTYMVATLIQLELAARACPPGAVGGAFATLMAGENLASAGGAAVGGWLHERGSAAWGELAAFPALVVIGALTTAASGWLLPRPEGQAQR